MPKGLSAAMMSALLVVVSGCAESAQSEPQEVSAREREEIMRANGGKEVVPSRTVAAPQAAPQAATEQASTPAAPPVPDLQMVKRRLAAKWGFDGWIECSYYTISAMAGAAREGSQDGLALTRNLVTILGEVKPLVNAAPDNSLVDGALRVFDAQHRNDPSYIGDAKFRGCAQDIVDANRA